MQLFGLNLPRLFKRASQPASTLKDPSASLMQLLLGGASSAAGVTVSPLTALGVSTVFACVRVLADTVATLPLEVRQRKGRSSRVATDHRLYTPLRDQPNPEMTSCDVRTALQIALTLRNKCFAEVLVDADGDPVGLYPFEPGTVDVSRDVVSKELHYTLSNGMRLRPERVLHLRSFTQNGLTSTETFVMVRDLIGLAIALQDNAAKFFGNGSRPSGVLEHPMQLSEEAQERLRAQVESQMSGDQLYRMLILEEGMKYAAVRSENKDSQFQEARQHQDLEVCRVFGVPPHKVGIQQGQPRANVEQDNLSFISDTIRPICVRWEQALNSRLFTDEERDQGYHAEFNLNALLRGDRQSRFASYATGRQWGILSVNDCRAEEGLPEIDGGDVYLQPVNMVDAKKADQLTAEAQNNVNDKQPEETQNET